MKVNIMSIVFNRFKIKNWNRGKKTVDRKIVKIPEKKSEKCVDMSFAVRFWYFVSHLYSFVGLWLPRVVTEGIC